MIGFGTYSGGLGTPGGLQRDGYLESQALSLDSGGHFEITLSQQPQPGNWLPMGPGTNSLNVRQTLLRRAEQQQAPLQLQRLGESKPPRPLDPARFSGALDRAGQVLVGTVSQFLAWTASFQEHRHEIRPLDPRFLAVAQGDPNTSYNYTYWELAEGEAFVIDLDPPACEYWNLQIGNHWPESLDFMSFKTHVNHETAVADPNEDSLALARASCGDESGVAAYSDYRELLEKAPVDAIVIASPNHTHAEVLEPVFESSFS